MMYHTHPDVREIIRCIYISPHLPLHVLLSNPLLFPFLSSIHLSPFSLPLPLPRSCFYMLTWCTKYNNYLINLGLSPPLYYTSAHSVSSCMLQEEEGWGGGGEGGGVVREECGSRLEESRSHMKHARNRVLFAE